MSSYDFHVLTQAKAPKTQERRMMMSSLYEEKIFIAYEVAYF